MERPQEARIEAPGTSSRRGYGAWRRGSWVTALLLLSALLPVAAAAADAAGQQLDFGADMARRGLWKEALFRFQQADRLDPDNPKILNNIAVSYEALGLFDQALETYQDALRLGRQDDKLRENYAKFLEFYQNFRPREESEETAEELAEEDLGEAPPPPSEERGE